MIVNTIEKALRESKRRIPKMKRLPKEDRAGLYITLIVHLVVLIILLAGRLGTEIYKENTFILDFTKVEQLEKLQRRLEFEQSVNDRLNELLSVSVGAMNTYIMWRWTARRLKTTATPRGCARTL